LARENSTIFGGNYFRQLLSATFGGYFHVCRQNLKTAKNSIDLFSVVFF
jgi:hypothetical protein